MSWGQARELAFIAHVSPSRTAQPPGPTHGVPAAFPPGLLTRALVDLSEGQSRSVVHRPWVGTLRNCCMAVHASWS